VKKLIYILLFIVQIATCSFRTTLNNQEYLRQELKGPVKFLIDSVKMTTFEFDKSKRLIDEINQTRRSKYKYDKFGNLVNETVYDNKDSILSEYNYTFSESGELLYYDFAKKDDFILKKTGRGYYIYYKNTNEIEEVFYDIDGNLLNKHIRKYDSQGYLLSTRYLKARLLTDEYKWEYKYDEYHNKIESTESANNNMVVKHTWAYNLNNQEISSTSYEPSMRPFLRSTHEYDSEGNLVKLIFYKDGEDDTDEIHEYKNTITDKYGNWFEREEYLNGELFERHKRKIIYFQN
jgi:YD repeat-containing protein